MLFTFTSEQRSFASTVADFLAAECTPTEVRAAWAPDRSGHDLGRWARLAHMGVVGMTVPEEYGGLGMNEVDLVLILEESGRAGLPEPVVETVAVGVPLLVETGSLDRLTEVAKGEAIVTVGLDDQPYVADAHIADLIVLERDAALHLVSRSAVELTAQPSVDGSRRLFSVAWRPGAETLIAEGPDAANARAAAFDRGALASAAQLLGISQRLLDMTGDYARERRQFGVPIGSFQAVKHHLADALLALELARPVVYRAAWSLAHESVERTVHVSMAKAYASDAADNAARVALQVHGAIGYTWECDVHLWMKRAWALGAAWGDAGWHRRRVGAALLGGS